MGRNLIIKDFDKRLGELVNEALYNGVDISTVVITLDKYLFSARESERQVLLNEQSENIKKPNFQTNEAHSELE